MGSRGRDYVRRRSAKKKTLDEFEKLPAKVAPRLSELAVITGATGALGPAVVDEFVRAGFRVRAHGRAERPDLFPLDVETVAADLTDPTQARRVVEGADCVVHLAAMLHISNPAPDLVAEYRRVNVEGTRSVLGAAAAIGARRFVYVSTIAVYGNDHGELLTEESEPRPSTAYATTKLEGERLVLSASVGLDQIPIGVVLRLAAVYGTRVKGNYRRLLRSIQRRRFLPIGSGHNRRTLVHERDVARAALLAATHPLAAGRLFNVSDGSIHTVAEIVAAISTALGRKPSRIAIPLLLVKIGAAVVDGVLRIGGRRALFVPAIEKYTEEVVVSSDAIQRDLGFVPEMDLAAGWRDVISRMSRSDL